MAGAGALVAATGCSVDLKQEPANTTGTTPIAAGSSTSLEIGFGLAIDHATSNDPTVLDVTGLGSGSVNVTAGRIGTATVTAYDALNHVVGTFTAQVAGTTAIALDPGVTSGLTVLVGESYVVHATTMGPDGVTLVGDGAIHFAYAGALASANGDCLFGGDCAGFQFNAAGDGQVVMTAASSSATNTLALHAVDAVDTFTLSPSSLDLDVTPDAGSQVAYVSYTISNAGIPVSATPQCVAADPNTARTIRPLGVPLLGATGGTIPVAGIAAGSTTLTCTVGGKTATFTVNVK